MWILLILLIKNIIKEKEVNELSKKGKKIKIHYGYDVSNIFGEPLFTIEYDEIYNTKGKLKKVKLLQGSE